MAQTKPKAGQFYGVSNNGTDGEFLQTDGVGGMAWASTIVDPTITSIDYPGTQTATDPAGGESVIINGTLFASGITCTVGGTAATTAFNSATQITITTPAKVAGAYTVAVTNLDGGTASQANFIQYSGVPIWTTASGNIGSVTEGAAASLQVTATEGSDTIEYAVTVGTLPSGLSLATATGAITGTAGSVSADTTTTFSITATDDENQTSAVRSFNIIVTNDPASNHFNTVLYNGNGGTQSITSLNFEPGLVWIKRRSAPEDHALFDIVRGTQQQISSNLMTADYTTSNAVSSFNSDGFTTGNNGATNASGQTYVAWNFKAGGAATTIAANTVGNTIASDVSVNNTLGFSIAKYTGTGVNGATVSHGLNAAPEIVFIKNLSGTSHWKSIMAPLGAGKALYLNLANSEASGQWDNTLPTTSVFTLDTDSNDNGSGNAHIAYSFTSKAGFSKVGTYTGNGSTSGPMVETGFEPAFIMIKKTSGADQWIILDNKRSTSNPRQAALFANLSDGEYPTYGAKVDFLANGFQIVNTDGIMNSSGGTYIYLAFAADGSTATPALANSFATELYTGNATVRNITTVGFEPDFTWVKNRSYGNNHVLFDSIRAGVNWINSNTTNAQYSGAQTTGTGFISNGISLGTGEQVNRNGNNFVSWNWKAGGTASINTDGTITSVVSVNKAAGFSIVKYTGNGTAGATIGHGLDATPEMGIFKRLDSSSSSWWSVYTETTGNTGILYLDLSDAFTTTSSRFNNTSPTSSLFTFGNSDAINASGGEYIGYCFKSITGYSKVGSYTGNDTSQTITTGFQPGFVMLKNTSTGATNWVIIDEQRGQGDDWLYPNVSDAEYDDASTYTSFSSNGFYVSSNSAYNNANGAIFIYLAIKEN